MTPFRGLTRDNNLRADSTVEKLGDAEARVRAGPGHPPTMTAGNSTPLSDGASTVLLGSDEWAAEPRPRPARSLVDAETGAVDYVHGDRKDDGLLMAPAYAVPRLLARDGMTLEDLDFYQIHEAFARPCSPPWAAWEYEAFRRRGSAWTGVRGRSTATSSTSPVVAGRGHPFAATGGRIVATHREGAPPQEGVVGSRRPVRALVSICAAGGLGLTAILEAA